VASVVARAEAEIGFQQVSELLPVSGIDYVGPLPPEIQQLTVFAAGIAGRRTQARCGAKPSSPTSRHQPPRYHPPKRDGAA